MDQFYFDSGYIDDKYFVVEYYGEATINSNASVEVMISHLYGVDISAFSNSSLTADAVVLRDAQATLNAQATIDQFAGDLYALRSASLSSEFAQTTDADRLRDIPTTLSSAFTLDIVASINGAIEAHGDWSTTFTLDITPELYKDMSASMYADAVMDPDGVKRIRSVDSTQAVEFTQTAINYRIVQGAASFDALFTPNMTVKAIKNAFAVLDSTAALATVAIANRSAQVALSSIINQSAQGMRYRGYAANVNSQFALTINYVAYNPTSATLSSVATLTTNFVKLRPFTASLSSAFTSTIVPKIIKGTTVAVSSAFTETSTAKITKGTTANLTAFFAELVIGQPTSFVSLSAVVSINCTPRAIRRTTTTVSSNFTLTSQPNYKSKYWIFDTTQPSYPRTMDSNSTGDLISVYYSTGSLNIEPIKVNKDGTIAWQKTTGFGTETTNQLPNDSVLDSSNNLYVVGRHNPGGTNYSLFVKYDSSGAVVFSKTIVGSNAWGITYANNNIYLTTTTLSNAMYFYEFNTNGTLLNSYSYTSAVTYNATNIVSDGTYFYVLGTNDPVGQQKIYVTCLDSSFNIVWNKNYTINADNHTCTGFKIDNAGSLFLSGYSTSTPSNINFLMKISTSNGLITWTKQLSNSYQINDLDVSNNYIYMAHNNYGVLRASTSDATISWNNWFAISNVGIDSRKLTVDTNKDSLYVGLTSGVLARVPLDGTRTGTYGSYDYLEQTSTTQFTDISGSSSNFTLTKTTYSPTIAFVTLTNTNSTFTGVLIPFYEMGSASLSSTFSTNLIPGKISPTRATLSSAFTETVRGRASYDPRVTFSSAFSETTTIKKFVGFTANLSSAFTSTTTCRTIKRTTTTLSAQAVVTVSTRKYVGNGASLFAVASVTANNGRRRSFSSSINAMASELAVVVKTGRGIVHFDSTATQVTNAVKTTRTNSNQISVATQVTDAYKTVKTGASVEARATLAITILKIPRSTVSMESAFVQTTTTSNSKITRITASVNTQFTELVQAIKTARTQKTLSAVASLTFGNQVTRLRFADSQQYAQFELIAPAVKTARIQSNLEAFAFEVAVGQKIAFDRELQLLIPNESGSLIVPEENTLLYVPIETRVNMVRKIAL